MKISKYYFNFFLVGFFIIFSYISKSEDIYDNFYHLNSDFNKVLCVDNNTVIVVGTNGAVLLSTDFGETWKHDFSGTHNDLYDIAKIDSNNIIAVGKNGTILRSTNKGLKWSVSNSLTSNDLRTVCFYNSQSGLIAGNNGTIFKTTNGGSSWDAITKFDTSNFVTSYIYNKNTIFLSDNYGNIYSTADCGLNWNIINNNGSVVFYPKNFSKNENGKVYLLTASAIFSTNDAGQTWEKMKTNSWFKTYPFTPQWISDFKNNKALAFSYQREWRNFVYPYLVNDSNNEISVTSLNLITDSLSSIQTAFFTSASFIDSLNGFAVGTDNSILKTTDEGTSWKLISLYKNLYFNVINVVNSTSTGAICFLNKNTGYIGSYYEKIYKTKDGGATWLPQKENDSLIYGCLIYGVYYSDENNGMAIADDQESLMTTTDGGETYHKKYSSAYGGYDICFIDDNNFLTAGDACVFMNNNIFDSPRAGVYTNKGDSCKIYINWDTASIHTCSAVGKDIYLFAGIKWDTVDWWGVYHSFFLRTSDKGYTWARKDIDFIKNVWKMRFIDSTTGLLIGLTPFYHNDTLGVNGIFKTTDAGESWRPVVLDTSIYLFQNMFANKSDTVYCVGYNVIWKTTDRGDTWIKYIDKNRNNHLLQGVFSIDNTTYIVGDSNLILKSINKDNIVTVAENLNTLNPNSNLLYIYAPFPNPAFDDIINFKFAWNNSLGEPNLTIRVCNVLGETVADLSNYTRTKIYNNIAIIQWDAKGIPAGLYYILYQENDYSRAKAFVIGKQ